VNQVGNLLWQESRKKFRTHIAYNERVIYLCDGSKKPKKPKAMKYKKINSLSQYNEYCNIHERLSQTDLKKDQDEIELLEVLIQDYDNRNSQSLYKELNPVELLKSLLENGNLSQADFSKQINISRQLVSDILNYRRNISKELVLKLADFFAMKQEAFSRPYSLKNIMDNSIGKSNLHAPNVPSLKLSLAQEDPSPTYTTPTKKRKRPQKK
jgi:HTH-type transcriptional regulator / antitoxin HigA